MKHTEGPWEISTNAAGDLDICAPDAGDMLADLTGCPNAEANAILMAAAPTMLDALQWLIDSTDVTLGDGGSIIGDDIRRHIEDVIRQATQGEPK